MNLERALEVLKSPEPVGERAFDVLRSIASSDTTNPGGRLSQELVLRCLDRIDEFNGTSEILRNLAREHGLFPYLDQEALGLREQIAYEFHKPGRLGEEGIVFHSPQARVFERLTQGESVILSAPTSFGKSLIIDALVLNERFNNILVVVPTIALIDETRRRLAHLRSPYKIITHAAQEAEERNVYVMTQERVVEIVDEIELDFFVLDEFYKLAPSRSADDQRVSILNHVFYRLASRGIQFYLLGPSVRDIAPELTQRFECTFIYEPFETVVSELHAVESGDDEFASLVRLCSQLEEPTIVYCRSPARAADVAARLAEARQEEAIDNVPESAIEWISEHFHEDWHFTTALQARIGVHHGRIPRSLAQYVVRAFDNDEIDILVCTSTLIEGVNTKARNIVVFDNRVSNTRFDFFTFNNIRGRSGRMFQHFVGHVYLFHEPPEDELPFIDIPSVTLSDDASDALLIQLDLEDLDENSLLRTRPFRDQTLLSIETLRANSGLDPEIQLGIAETILAYSEIEARQAVGWSARPQYEQLQAVCQLIWANVNGSQLGSGSVRSSAQLAYRIHKLRRRPSVRSLIDDQLDFLRQRDAGASADAAVVNVLDFLRLWAGFHFPRLLTAVDRIQQEIMRRRGLPPGDLSPFAAEVESLFLGSHIIALEEFGLPVQVGTQLPFVEVEGATLDDYLEQVRRWNVTDLPLTEFPRELFLDLQASIGD
jgi:rhodanese-related sulfurtransferase